MTRKTLASTRRVVFVAAVAVVALLAMTASAFASSHHPTGAYAPFADCPLSNPSTTACLLAKTESGEFTLGKERVPIVNTITLQGGLDVNKETGAAQVIGAEDGNTLSETAQKVPGGLLGLVKCNEISEFFERVACELVFENGVTGVNETTELAAPASSIGLSLLGVLTGKGTGLSLPVKVHLENPLLGSACYLGSNAHPIVIEFTSGTTSPPAPNKPITGKPGSLTGSEGGTILTISGNELVNNSFAAPGAEGCGGIFSFLLDPIINSKLGLPSAAGNNTAILAGTLKTAEASAVKASE
jgi:hypothetical protein